MAKPIKIAYIIDKLTGDLGGTENQLIKIINGLNNNGRFQIHLICFDDSVWFQANASVFKCNSIVIKINKFKNLSTYLNFLKLIRFLQDYKPDVVHTFFPVGNIVGVLAARLAGINNIISSRRDYGEWMNRHYLFATRFANKFAKNIIANSNQVKELTERKEKINNGKVKVILNGIDTGIFNDINHDNALKKRLNISENTKVVGIVANIKPVKNYNIFLKAAKEVLRIRDDVSFLIVGDGPMREEIEKFGHTLHISEKLHFAGAQKNIVPYLSIMDVGINCSKREGLSNAIMEYMATGVPCIVSNVGGNPDLITHNFNGYIFEFDDYKTLASLILKLLEENETRDKFIRNAQEKIVKEMSLDTMLTNYKILYKTLVDNSLIEPHNIY